MDLTTKGEELAVERFTFPELSKSSGGEPPREEPLVTWPECDVTETVSDSADAARRMLRQLSPSHPQVVMFTSPGDGDGKTGVLIALAPELAKRAPGGVLVVDANFRKPDLTVRLSVPRRDALAEPSLIYPTNLPRLSVLPAPAVEGPQLRCFDSLESEELREGWSLVLVDAVSLVHPEAVAMTGHCDGVYLVVRLGYTPRRAVAEAAQVLRGAGAPLLGCVVVE